MMDHQIDIHVTCLYPNGLGRQQPPLTLQIKTTRYNDATTHTISELRRV